MKKKTTERKVRKEVLKEEKTVIKNENEESLRKVNEIAESSKTVKKRINPAEYERAFALYETGKYTIEEVAKTIGVSIQMMHSRIKERGIVKGKMVEEQRNDIRESIKASHQFTPEEASDIWAEEQRGAVKRMHYYGDMALKVSNEAYQSGKMAEALPVLKAIDQAMEIQRKRTQTIMDVIGRDAIDRSKERELPSLLIAAMSPEEEQRIKTLVNSSDLDIKDEKDAKKIDPKDHELEFDDILDVDAENDVVDEFNE